jgi:large subunit ribosomal protein L1
LPLSNETITKALEELKGKTTKRKFNQSIEMQVKLRDIDLKKPETRIQEMVELPDPMDKNVKVAVIAGGDLATRAREAGADMVIGKDVLDKIGKEKKEARKIANAYDYFVAEAPLMPLVGRSLGQILGPRGKMPLPVPPTAPIGDVIKRQRRNVRIRMKDQPVLQCKIGTEDMPTDAIVRNVQAVLARIEAKAEKGPKNISWVRLKASMGPPVKISYRE